MKILKKFCAKPLCIFVLRNYCYQKKKHFNIKRIFQFIKKTINLLIDYRLAESKKEEGNKLYKQKKYQEALKFYSGAIGNYIFQINLIFFS
jgi:hypothetical protein